MSNDNLPARMWINQPSTSQPNHSLHGVRVLAIPDNGPDAPGPPMMRVYFLKGSVIDQRIPRAHLSDGWPPTSRTNPKVRFNQEENET